MRCERELSRWCTTIIVVGCEGLKRTGDPRADDGSNEVPLWGDRRAGGFSPSTTMI
jgi:hypothetical protein